MTALLVSLVERRAAGGKLLVPYVMAGLPSAQGWPEVLAAVTRHADAVEIGVPYSDPLMDGPVIAGAGERAVAAGIDPSVAVELAAAPSPAPKLLMTYYNPIHRVGESEFCKRAAGAGVAGLIVPDLPLEESESLRAAAAARRLAWVPLIAPSTSPDRVVSVAATATGFVYAVSTLGVTGTREALSERAAEVARRCKDTTDVPVLVGIGVSTPEQAVEACEVADGVVIGSAVVRLVDEGGAAAAADFLGRVREALDSVRSA